MNNSKKSFLFIFFFTVLYSIFVYSQEIEINKNEIKKDNIFLLSKTFRLEGEVRGSIFAIGGKILINGNVTEDIVCIGSELIIGQSARITGNLLVFGGKIDKDPQAVVKGDYFFTKLNLKKIESTILPFLIDKTGKMSIYRIIKLILWIIIALVLFSVFSQHVIDGKEILRKNILKVLLFGVFSIITFIFLLIIFIILSFFFIGIPFTIALVIIFIMLIMFGRVLLFLYIGSLINEKLLKKDFSPVVYILIGGILYGILKMIPLISSMTSILNILEIGAAVVYFGRNKIKLKSGSQIDS
jgi:hypothetical protein